MRAKITEPRASRRMWIAESPVIFNPPLGSMFRVRLARIEAVGPYSPRHKKCKGIGSPSGGTHLSAHPSDRREELNMSDMSAFYRLAGIGLACVLAAPAHAQLKTQKVLSYEVPTTIATTAVQPCTP